MSHRSGFDPADATRERGRMSAGHGLAVSCRRVVHIYRAEAGDVVALLAGLMRPSAGVVSVGTYDMGKLTDKEISRLRGTQIGVVVQGAVRNLLPYASLRRNILLAQRRAARTKGVKLDEPDRVLDLVGLGGLGQHTPETLAPGARQRAALAVGIAVGPGLLLVDEPTSQLDAHGRDEVMQALETVNRERGTTIVVVTHDAEVGERLGRAVTIRDGRVGAEGRGGRDFAVVAGDGTVQLPPAILDKYPPGTLFTVGEGDEEVVLRPNATSGTIPSQPERA